MTAPTVLRPHAEQDFRRRAGRAGRRRRPAPAAELAAVAVGGRRPTCSAAPCRTAP